MYNTCVVLWWCCRQVTAMKQNIRCRYSIYSRTMITSLCWPNFELSLSKKHCLSLCFTVGLHSQLQDTNLSHSKKSYALEKVLNHFSNGNFFALFFSFSENSKMKHSVKGSGTILMKPQLDSSVTHQPSEKKKLTKVTHKNHMHMRHILSLSNVWIYISEQNIIPYSESITALTQEAAARCGDSQVQTQKPTGPRFSSCLSIRCSRKLGPDNPELRIKKNLDPCLHR